MNDPLSRYNEAHRLWSLQHRPNVVNDGFYCKPKYPDVTTSNGITTYVINYLTWLGYYANRINVSGRLLNKTTKSEGGIFKDSVWIKSSTKKGTADINAIIHGKSVSIEVKNKYTGDKIREAQLMEKKRIESAGGVYLIVTSVESFLDQLDSLLYG